MELPLTVHNEDFEEVQKMALVSNSLVAKFFEIYPGDEDNADAWTASADAFDLRHDLQKVAILGKRKGSTPFPLGEEVLAKKAKEMEQIIGIQAEVNMR
ncbi:MAG: hypothetical protein MMC33_002763 [Icmadophila ericetorum]|nr:hypothetical protein [Icmadophila ericetorum]